MESTRNKRNTQTGIVIKKSGKKTINVEISKRQRHPFYKKVITLHNRLLVHDEKEECNVGDIVLVVSTRPLSKQKKWRFVRKVSL